MAPGDHVLLIKQAGIEGTAVLAQELGDELRARGVADDALTEALGFVNRLSIAAEGRICADEPGTSALHDVTEGGVATALSELSLAGGNRIYVDADRIPVHPTTQTICAALDAGPLGLLGSGALLVCCRAEAEEGLVRRLTNAGIPVAVIGEVGEEGRGVAARRAGEPAD